MSRDTWLETESERWQHDGLITEDTRRAILARYPKRHTDPANALMSLAVLTAGVGVVLLVAWHWKDLASAVKLGLATLFMIVMYGGAAWAAGRQRTTHIEMWTLGAAFSSYALVAAIADVYVWNDLRTAGILCAAAAALTAAASGTTLVSVLAATTLIWWLIIAGGGAIPWECLIVFPLVAIAAEQSRHRSVAVLTAMACGAFAMILAANTFNNSNVVALVVIIAGAAIEQGSHQPASRRLVFARATPGAIMSVGGLIVMLLSVVHAGPASGGRLEMLATHGGQSVWPALVLAAGLLVIAVGPSAHAAWRPRMVAFTAAVWLSVTAGLRPTLIPDTLWIALFSGALLLLGASLVREAARTEDRGTFAVGLIAVIGLVLVHFSSGAALRGSAVLLVSAVLLFIVGRQARRAGNTEVSR